MPDVLPLSPTSPTRRERGLTTRHLSPAIDDLGAFLLDVRRDVDSRLATAPTLMVRRKPYPLGYCQEITQAVFAAVNATTLASSRHPGAKALRSFLTRGGTVRLVWGALRGRYFQNAMQMGGLYVDVANDTVDVNKPKIEILPIAESGLEAIRSPAHFAEIAGRYWGATIYANHALPALAPLLPMIGVTPGWPPCLHSPNMYMTALMRRSRFALSTAWIAEAPPAPDDVVADLLARWENAHGAHSPPAGRDAALQSCADACRQGLAEDPAWTQRHLGLYLHAFGRKAANGGDGTGAVTHRA